MMEIREKMVDNAIILELKGKITIGAGDVVLRQKIEEILSKDVNNIVLNLARVSYIDSSGTGELVSCYTKVKKKEGKLVLLNISQKIKDILQIAQLMSIFEYFTDEEEAIASF